MMFLMDLRVAADGQISDKYQPYGLTVLPDSAVPNPSHSRRAFAQEAHSAQENRLLA
ncbi:hypothetical protein [Mesorhizobium sp. NFR06]|uniref:hypothetical protein n=1 Tax=Mesorhizobium sp. NFR06 TaxID=1566290 RepID=UPI00165F83AE|nr:hypothetical protein [Mesorhizobium sp. NFR06]